MNTSDSHLDTDIHGNGSLATTTSIAKDVSLATTRVDTDEDQYQGLDLSVGTRKINSQLFDTKSLDREIGTFDQPLDLTCSKTLGVKEEESHESTSSSQMDLQSANNEFNYVYVYPGLYPPGAVVNAHDDLEPHQEMTSPVPELMSPGKIPSPDTLSRAQYLATTEALESAYAMTNPDQTRFKEIKECPVKQISPAAVSPVSTVSPNSAKREPGELETKAKSPSYQYSSKSPNRSGRGGKAKDSKKSTEIKVISENTSAGVYTSVMKLPWSRRTRTKKVKDRVKLEDTLVPQFMLEVNQRGKEDVETVGLMSAEMNEMSGLDSSPLCSAPASSQSVMMVYPNAATTSLGRPMKKRGRPPKLPMLTKLLHIRKKGNNKPKSNDSAHATRQVPTNGDTGDNGQVTATLPGETSSYPAVQPIPVPVAATSEAHPLLSTLPSLQNPTVPNMAQAHFIGQIPLSQITGGPIQFLGQFPANALPFPAPTLQAIPLPISTASPQGTQVSPVQSKDESANVADGKAQNSMPPVGVQYAFQPMFVPQQMAVPLPQPAPVAMETSETNAEGQTECEQTSPGDNSYTQSSLNPAMITAGSTQVMQLSDSSTISTMSTTSISNTESGAIYQEMILSSKSLVDVKKRRRQTAIQMLKSKSGDSNFLCTSFRIRPRLVAQAQAQRERLAARGLKEEEFDDGEPIDPKNLTGPQNDESHFGENNGCDVDFSNIQIKQEIDEDDELYANVKEYEINVLNQNKAVSGSGSKQKSSLNENKSSVPPKRYILKGSQKRKAKFYGSRIVNEQAESSLMKGQGDKQNANAVGGTAQDSSDLFQEMFNCKICNKIISVDDMEAHSLDHLKSTVYQCTRCGRGFNEAQVKQAEQPVCSTCNEPLVTLGDLGENGESRIACDECDETFKSLPEFYEHKTAHKNTQNAQGGFECDFCGKIYQYYHALQFHRRTHRERRVPCVDKSCDMKFRSRKEMENHFDTTHRGEKEYFHCVYEGCTKKFLKNFHLQEHIRVKHYNIKAFQCPWPGCVKEFAAQRHLKIHLLIHRDEKPMKCDHCDYRCRQRSAMNWHMRKHPDVPYKYKRAVKSPSISKSESE